LLWTCGRPLAERIDRVVRVEQPRRDTGKVYDERGRQLRRSNTVNSYSGEPKAETAMLLDGAWRMFPTYVLLVAIPVVSLTGVQARAAEKEKEPLAIIELGGAGEWGLSGGSSFGPSAAVEFEPIKDWLEIEIGSVPLFDHGHTEWDTDILFKKPFSLSEKLEFMIGAGPQWSQPTNGMGKLGAEFALDFMFWPTKDRKVGWFVEPSYSYLFAQHEQSLGVSMGLLIPIQPN
jgi:hypothetical protein